MKIISIVYISSCKLMPLLETRRLRKSGIESFVHMGDELQKGKEMDTAILGSYGKQGTFDKQSRRVQCR
jgi:hypothetical protein